MKGIFCREPAVEKDCDCFQEDLDESNPPELSLSFSNKEDYLPRAFLFQSPIMERFLYNDGNLHSISGVSRVVPRQINKPLAELFCSRS